MELSFGISLKNCANLGVEAHPKGANYGVVEKICLGKPKSLKSAIHFKRYNAQ